MSNFKESWSNLGKDENGMSIIDHYNEFCTNEESDVIKADFFRKKFNKLRRMYYFLLCFISPFVLTMILYLPYMPTLSLKIKMAIGYLMVITIPAFAVVYKIKKLYGLSIIEVDGVINSYFKESKLTKYSLNVVGVIVALLAFTSAKNGIELGLGAGFAVHTALVTVLYFGIVVQYIGTFKCWFILTAPLLIGLFYIVEPVIIIFPEDKAKTSIMLTYSDGELLLDVPFVDSTDFVQPNDEVIITDKNFTINNTEKEKSSINTLTNSLKDVDNIQNYQPTIESIPHIEQILRVNLDEIRSYGGTIYYPVTADDFEREVGELMNYGATYAEAIATIVTDYTYCDGVFGTDYELIAAYAYYDEFGYFPSDFLYYYNIANFNGSLVEYPYECAIGFVFYEMEDRIHLYDTSISISYYIEDDVFYNVETDVYFENGTTVYDICKKYLLSQGCDIDKLVQ